MYTGHLILKYDTDVIERYKELGWDFERSFDFKNFIIKFEIKANQRKILLEKMWFNLPNFEEKTFEQAPLERVITDDPLQAVNIVF